MLYGVEDSLVSSITSVLPSIGLPPILLDDNSKDSSIGTASPVKGIYSLLLYILR